MPQVMDAKSVEARISRHGPPRLIQVRAWRKDARGIRSPAYEPGPDSEVREAGTIQFVDWVTSFIGR
jgi:hypothetical protein